MTTPGDDTEEVVIEVPQDPRAAAVARAATRDVLRRWRLGSVLDDVLLAVSELVTNAVVHGKPRVWLVLRRRPASVDVTVHDGRPTSVRPMLGNRSDSAESGRGLQIVTDLSERLSYEDVPGAGKFARASFPTDDGDGDHAEQVEAT